MKNHYCILLSCAALTLAACASTEPGRMFTETSAPMPVDPYDDNRAVMDRQAVGLVVTMKIDGDRVELSDSQIMLIPKAIARQQTGEQITLIGLRGGETVTQVRIPDQRLNIQEKRGIVVLEQRTLQAALPLPAPIDELLVQLPGAEQPVRFPIAKAISTFCRKHPKQNLCRKSEQ